MSTESYSSSDEMSPPLRHTNDVISSRPCCSSIQYSHVPETSAFQRHNQSPTHSRSTDKATTSTHRTGKYRRSFTTYDGITTRTTGRQSVSVSCKHDDFPKTHDRLHKQRQSTDVGDYKLMDTVHYLAQGEFAPRDDGIKLTPSREAVLSDIIWEDVCRTHWPTARLGRRRTPAERNSRRGELQKLIDGLLRERVAHVERRRRRHYRTKTNSRPENNRAAGKTGDIIVASHKEKEVQIRNASTAIISYNREKDGSYHRDHNSHDRLVYRDPYQNSKPGNSTSPGTSNPPSPSMVGSIEHCCGCQHSQAEPVLIDERPKRTKEIFVRRTGSASTSTSKHCTKSNTKNTDFSTRRQKREESGTKQYVLLSTILVRNPTSKNNEMELIDRYHRVINVDWNKDQDYEDEGSGSVVDEIPLISPNTSTQEIGLCTDTVSHGSEEED